MGNLHSHITMVEILKEAQEDLRMNKNFNIYKGAVYESVVAEMLKKQGYELYFYYNEKSTIEILFP